MRFDLSSDSTASAATRETAGNVASGAERARAAAPAQVSGSNGTITAADGSQVQPPAIVRFFPPFYPLSSRMDGIEGRVDLQLAIDANGDVVDVAVAGSTAPQFQQFAVAAAKEWKFTPALRDGQPIGVRVPFPVPFVSEFGSGGMPANSPLARLVSIRGTIYTVDANGRYVLANAEVTPLLRPMPSFDGAGDKELRVVLGFTVDPEGQVVDPQVVESSSTEFDRVALMAVRFWQFLPQIREGKPVASKVKLPLVFNPAHTPG